MDHDLPWRLGEPNRTPTRSVAWKYWVWGLVTLSGLVLTIVFAVLWAQKKSGLTLEVGARVTYQYYPTLLEINALQGPSALCADTTTDLIQIFGTVQSLNASTQTANMIVDSLAVTQGPTVSTGGRCGTPGYWTRFSDDTISQGTVYQQKFFGSDTTPPSYPELVQHTTNIAWSALQVIPSLPVATPLL